MKNLKKHKTIKTIKPAKTKSGLLWLFFPSLFLTLLRLLSYLLSDLHANCHLMNHNREIIYLPRNIWRWTAAHIWYVRSKSSWKRTVSFENNKTVASTLVVNSVGTTAAIHIRRTDLHLNLINFIFSRTGSWNNCQLDYSTKRQERID